MKLAVLLSVGWLSAAAVMQARIGETRKEIGIRFGAPVQTNSQMVTVPSSGYVRIAYAEDTDVHEKNGVYIEVSYVKDRCERIFYHKKPGVAGSDGFTDEEIDVLLAANRPEGAHWKKPSYRTLRDGTLVAMMETSDGKVAVDAARQPNRLAQEVTFSTPEWTAHVKAVERRAEEQKKAAAAAAAKEKLGGF